MSTENTKVEENTDEEISTYCIKFNDYINKCMTVTGKKELPDGCDTIGEHTAQSVTILIIQYMLDKYDYTKDGIKLSQKEKAKYLNSHATFKRNYDALKPHFDSNYTEEELLSYVDMSLYKKLIKDKVPELFQQQFGQPDKFNIREHEPYLKNLIYQVIQESIIANKQDNAELILLPDEPSSEQINYNATNLIGEINQHPSHILRNIFKSYWQTTNNTTKQFADCEIYIMPRVAELGLSVKELALFKAEYAAIKANENYKRVNKFQLKDTVFQNNLKKFHKYYDEYLELGKILTKDIERFKCFYYYITH